MRDGWYIYNGCRIVQPMVFSSDHAEFPNQPKGMKAVLQERNLWKQGLKMQCKNGCEYSATACCAKRILELQQDFKEQRSMVQEVIEEAGHYCLFLPKFHCELNFIEYFWGTVKRYLRENCDYTFATLQKNMPQALRSVDINRIRLWEHRVVRWIKAYEEGLNAKDAQFHVRKYSSHIFKSHRRPSETSARTFDR